MHPLIQTWEISHQINELLFGSLKDEFLADQPATKGRTVGQQIAHIHNVRLMWISASAPELMKGLKKFDKEERLTIPLLRESMMKSCQVMSQLLEQGIAAGKIKGFKPHTEAFVGYLIAHEAHHRGQIILSLKENKHLPDKKILFGLWEWGNKDV